MIIANSNNLKKPLLSIFPSNWKDVMGDCTNLEFRNLQHFKNVVSKLKQKRDTSCGVSYEKALDDLIKGVSPIKKDDTVSIRNEVRENLHKRGLITQEIYEAFKYTSNGTQVGVDVAKYASGDPECVMSPNVEYIDFFYELYVSVSYASTISNKTIVQNVIKLLSTIEELERQKIAIKITLVFPASSVSKVDSAKFFSSVPLFSYTENKSVDTMASVINDRLLRKFYFAILEDIYGENLTNYYGRVTALDGTFNIGQEFDAVQFFSSVKKSVGAENVQ